MDYFFVAVNPSLAYSGHVFLPTQLLVRYEKKDLEIMYFKLESTFDKQVIVGVKEFMEETDIISAPEWVLKHLQLESGDQVKVTLYEKKMNKINFALLSSLDSEIFDDVDDIKQELCSYLKNFQCIHLKVSYPFKNFTFSFSLLKDEFDCEIELGSCLDTDISIDFDIRQKMPVFKNNKKTFSVPPSSSTLVSSSSLTYPTLSTPSNFKLYFGNANKLK
jgi:hypothetical protein